MTTVQIDGTVAPIPELTIVLSTQVALVDGRPKHSLVDSRPALAAPKGPLLPPVIEAANAGPRLGFMPVLRIPVADATSTRGRKRRPLPAISLGKGVMRKYEAEKMYGLRRENGALKLKSLRNRHYEIIARHLAGQSGEQIHLAMNLSMSTISRVLNDPLVQNLLRQTYKDRQAELDALAGKAIHAVREVLEQGSNGERLAAVDKYTKLKQVIAPESNPMESAEDFARAIVNHGTMNVQINGR